MVKRGRRLSVWFGLVWFGLEWAGLDTQTVCFGLGKGNVLETKQRHLGQWSRAQTQLLSVHVALHWLRRKINA